MSTYQDFIVQAEVGLLAFTGEPDTLSRVDFDYTHSVGEAPKGSVTVYNPPDGFASALHRDTYVRVSAGWNRQLGAVFAGYPIKDGVELSEGKDVSLTVKVAPNTAESWRRAVAVSSRGQKSYTDAVSEVITDMGLKVGTLDLSLAPTYLARGFAFEGPGWRALRTLAASASTDIVFDGDTVSLIRPEIGIPAGMEEIPLFSHDKGNLIGPVKRTDKGLEINTFMDLRIRVGARVGFAWYDRFAGTDQRGVFVVSGLQHRGSSHGAERTTQVTCRRAGSLP